jgi:hypothetical protein
MYSRILIATLAFSFASIELSAAENESETQITKSHEMIMKAHHKRGPRGKRGHKGRHGHKGHQGQNGPNGPAGANGLVVISDIYADAFFQQDANSGPTTFTVANGAIKFNQVNHVNGVDTSQLLSNGAFVIQSAGKYLVSYNVYASFNITKPPAIPAYIAVLVNGTAATPSIVGTVIRDPTLQMSGEIILNLNVNDTVQIAPRNQDLLSLASLPTEPLKIASLTIQKL